jgi:hypothetical protein
MTLDVIFEFAFTFFIGGFFIIFFVFFLAMIAKSLWQIFKE